jgi:hypothetical protein
MAPAIIAAIISAAASKVKSNQESAQAMNQGNKTGGAYQIDSMNGENSSSNSYQPTAQSTNTIGNGSSGLAKNIIGGYLEKKFGDTGSNTSSAVEDVASQAAESTY